MWPPPVTAATAAAAKPWRLQRCPLCRPLRAPRHRQYTTVQRTVYKTVPVVTEQEVTQTICEPKTRTEERERIICTPVTKEEVRKPHCVYKTECVEQGAEPHRVRAGHEDRNP